MPCVKKIIKRESSLSKNNYLIPWFIGGPIRWFIVAVAASDDRQNGHSVRVSPAPSTYPKLEATRKAHLLVSFSPMHRPFVRLPCHPSPQSLTILIRLLFWCSLIGKLLYLVITLSIIDRSVFGYLIAMPNCRKFTAFFLTMVTLAILVGKWIVLMTLFIMANPGYRCIGSLCLRID